MSRTESRDFVLPLGDFDTIDQVVSVTREAESLGYGHVTAGETTGWNVLLLLAALARETDRIGLADNVVSPYARSPALMGQSAATLQAASDGRFRIRLGASSPALTERWHGVEYDRPLRRVRESIEIARAVQTGERVTYDGEIFTPDGLQLACPAPSDPAPIDVAALGPKAVEMTGRFADGWVPQLLTFDGLVDRLEDLRRGAELGDRDPDALRVAHVLRCCALPDGDRARNMARQHVAFMIARYGPYYRAAIANAGWGDLTEEVRTRWSEGDREGAVAAVTDELLEELVAVGRPDEARTQVQRFESLDDVDAIQVGFLGAMDRSDLRQTLEVLAPDH